MPVVLFKGCNIDIPNLNDGYALDPCNCSTYYVVRSGGLGGQEQTLITCSGDRLWNFRNKRCEPLQSVLQSQACDPNNPWNRCLAPLDDHKIRRQCILEGHNYPAISDGSKINSMPFSNQNQAANMELALAAFVAGVVITIFLIAIILTFCGLSRLRLPSKITELLNKKITFGNKDKNYVTSTKITSTKTIKTKKKTEYSKPSRETAMETVTVDYDEISGTEQDSRGRQRQYLTAVSSDTEVKVISQTTHVSRGQASPQQLPIRKGPLTVPPLPGNRNVHTSMVTSSSPRKPIMPPPKRRN